MQSSASGSDKVTPLYEIPYTATPNFEGRTKELEDLHQFLTSSEGAIISAVAGMGGVGKTQLAVQYATRHKADYPGGIYWLNGRTGDLATQILLKAEFDLQLEGLAAAKEQYTDLAQLVQWCWRHWTPDETTLVVLDDIGEWAKCRAYCPKEARFRVLVTTRRKDVLPNFPRIDLEMLQPLEARLLLAKLEGHGRVDQQPELADQLCEGLGYLPLGIELVGCYLARDRHITLSQIWERLQENRMRDPALARSQEDEITATLGVEAAFNLTWATMEAEAQEVAQLLSYFALDWIEWDLAEAMMQRVKGEAYSLEALKARLENASLVQIEKDAPWVCRLHPLIRQFLQEQETLATRTAGERRLRSTFVSVMIAIASQMPSSPTTKDIEWFSWVRSHVQEVAEHYTAELEGEDLLWSFIGLAQFYEGQALFTQAESWYAECREMTQRLYEGDHPNVATSLNNLANFYASQGRLYEAEPLYLQALEMTQRLYEGDHPSVAMSLNNLANFYASQGRLYEAEPLCLQALEMWQRLYEDDHPNVATGLSSLASLYASQGRLYEAEPLYLQALEMKQRLYEGDHPDVATSLNSLATLHQSQGRLGEAEPLQRQALEMRQRLYEDDHPNVAMSLNNLANLYVSQGRYSEVEPLYLQALEMTRRLYEGDHPDVATSLNNLATLHQSQGRLGEAEPLQRQALEMRQRLHESDHPDVALSLHNLAYLYRLQGRYSEAEPLHEQALAMFERTVGTNHPNTQTARKNLAIVRQQTQRIEPSTPPNPRLIRRPSLFHRLLQQIKRVIRRLMRCFS